MNKDNIRFWINTTVAFALGTSMGGSALLPQKGGSDVINEYAKQIKIDQQHTIESFNQAGTEDLSGMGYGACTVNSDCLNGVEVCVAGTTPNTLQQPGYCTPE